MAQATRRAGLLFAAGRIGRGRALATGERSRGKDNGTLRRHKVSRRQRGLDTEKGKREKLRFKKNGVGRTNTEGRCFPLGPVWTPMEALHSHGHIQRTLCLFAGKFQKCEVPGQNRLGEGKATYLKIGHAHQSQAPDEDCHIPTIPTFSPTKRGHDI